MMPQSFVPQMVNENMHAATNKLSRQMQDMQLGPPPPGNSMGVNHQSVPPGNQAPYMFSPQYRAQTTTVTYSGPPNTTYPYNNNNPNMPKSPNLQPYSNGTDPKMGLPSPTDPYSMQSPVRNNISNGHESKFQTGSLNQPQHVYQHPASPQNPPNFINQQPVVSNNPLNTSTPRGSAPNPPFNVSNTSSPSHTGYQNVPAPPVGFSTPSGIQSGPIQYSGMPPSPPNSGGMWPNQPVPGVAPPGMAPPGIAPPGAVPPGAVPPGVGNYPYGPPNPAMPIQQQPKRLDLDQMPSLVAVREEDRQNRGGYYPTDTKGQIPPLVTTNFIVQDRGLCSPRFIRSTVYCLPNQPDVLKQTGIPFALTISPFATVNEQETSPPMALFRDQGPLRCKRCKAYMCSFMTFLEGGRCFQCAFCKVVTEVPQDYFCFLDGVGERTDKYHRPELCLGSYEFLATKEYCRNDQMPNPPAYIFMIEVSHATFRNGLVPFFCENMKSVLQCLKNNSETDTSKLRIGFVTYNNVLHFYNMKKNLTQPHIMVLSDVHNAFVPLLDGFLVTLSEAEALVDGLMEHIPRLFMNEPATEVILGPVIQVGLEALKNANCSGKLLVFHATIPNADAPGKLPHREGQKLLGTDKQKSVLSPQHEFYYKLAQDCVTVGCAVDLFLFPNSYVDLATMAPLCRHTGGQIFKYTYFQSHIDGDRFLEDLERNITTPTAFDAVLRVRTSAGISPVFYYGNFYMSNNTDVEVCALDGNKAITIEMAYDDKLPENETVHVQAALLYTSLSGERRIRVHNLAIPTSSKMHSIYQGCEMDTIVNYMAKLAVKQVIEVTPQQIKSNLVNRAIRMLSCYRKHCSDQVGSVQLILPDTLKLLPLYVNCMLKSDAIVGGSELTLDDRSFAMLAMNTMDVLNTAIYFYPTLIPLHNVDPDSDDLPGAIRCSVEKLNENGAYLLENGIYMFLWIGQGISSQWLQDVFGVQSTNQVDKQRTSLPLLETALSKRIHHIIEDLEEGRQWYMRLRIMVQGDKLESVFRQFLVEDRGLDGSSSYVEFLCHLHREISKNI